jgi:hypothetical protein
MLMLYPTPYIGMVVVPNFGHSGVQESLLTQAHRKSQLITVQTLGGQSGRGVCPMTPHTDWFHVNVTLVNRDLTHEGRSETTINTGPQ